MIEKNENIFAILKKGCTFVIPLVRNGVFTRSLKRLKEVQASTEKESRALIPRRNEGCRIRGSEIRYKEEFDPGSG